MSSAVENKTVLHPTHNDLAENSRASLVELLQGTLTDGIDLKLQAKQAHWNVKGPSFIALHELFDAVAGLVEGFVDEIAERITALGGIAIGTSQSVAENTNLPNYPTDISRGTDHVEAFATALATFGKTVRAAIDAAEELNDADTADLFTGISREVDKQLWFVEAHNQADA